MANIPQGYISIQLRPSCIATLSTIYGIGKIKASRLNDFLMNHPNQNNFDRDLESLMLSSKGRNIINKLFIETKVRLSVSHNLRDKILIFTYKATRIFQGLPTNGQRTHGNAGTPSRLNPYKSLKVNLSFYPVLEIAYKRREFKNNNRYELLKAYNTNLAEKETMQKEDKKKRKKADKSAYYKQQKNAKQ